MVFNSIHYFYIATTLILTAINLNYINKNAYMDTLVKYRTIKAKESTSISTRILATLDFIYMFCSIIFFLIASVTGNALSFIVFLIIIISHFVGYISLDMAIKKKSKLVKLASKKTKTPQAVLDFKVDAHLLMEEDYNYLLAVGEKDKKLKVNKINQLLDMVGIKNLKSKDKHFPLFSEVILFVCALDDDLIDADNPLLNQYILENIMLLSTVMNILNSEKLVAALKTTEGLEELKDLVNSMKVLNMEIKKITQYIKKEKLTYLKATDSAELTEQLNEIRSMKEFVGMVK